MSEWWQGPMLSFDTETTGLDASVDRLVTIALVEANATEGTSQVHHWVLDCGVEVPVEAVAIHGWTTERVRAEGSDPGPIVSEVSERIESHLGQGLPVVGYNVSFDFGFLNTELTRHGLDPLDPRPVIDPLIIDKGIDRYRRGRRTLTAAAAHYNIILDGAHDAAADALAAARLAWRLGQLGPVASMSLSDLHDAQVGWAREQAESLRSYFVSQGKPTDDISGDWPVRI